MKLIRMIKDLESLKDKYDDLKLLLEDQVRDNQIEEAKETFEELLSIKESIEQMENLEVKPVINDLAEALKGYDLDNPY